MQSYISAARNHEVDLIKNELNVSDACRLFVVIRKLIEVSDLYHAFASARHNSNDPSPPCSPADLMQDIIAGPLALAKSDGLVRQTLTEEEVLSAIRAHETELG